MISPKRGDIYYADLSPSIGCEQGGLRPVLVVQNDIGNRFSPTIIVVAITSKFNKAKLPTHIEIKAENCGLSKDSIVLCEQVKTIDKRRLKEPAVGHIEEKEMKKVDQGMVISFGLAG